MIRENTTERKLRSDQIGLFEVRLTYAAPCIMQAAKRETDEKVARGREDYDEDEVEEEEEEENEEEEEAEEGCGRGPVSTSA